MRIFSGLASLLIGLFLWSFCLPASALGETSAHGLLLDRSLNVLTINLLFSEVNDRQARLARVADFVAQQAEQGKPIDFILMQEVVGGLLAGTDNSSQDLQELLATRGLDFHLSWHWSNSALSLISEGNAILSRWEILQTVIARLPLAAEDLSSEFQVPLQREIALHQVFIPGFGPILVYNTHLCSHCPASERLAQIQAVADFVIQNETDLESADHPQILGGDFNLDLTFPDEEEAYQTITSLGFLDSFGLSHDCYSCCSEEEGYDGCTYGVVDNPYAFAPARIDYIFVKNMVIGASEVVLAEAPWWVSDHSGLLAEVFLP